MHPDPQRSELGQFLAELRRRRVVRFVIGYAAVSFVLLQLAEIVFPAFGIGEGGLRLLVVTLTLGFLPAVVLAWIYDVTKEGIRRTEDKIVGRPLPRRLTLAAFALTTMGVAAGAGWYLAAQGVIGGDLVESRVVYDPQEPIRSLAVLPLDDFSAEGGQEYFAAGMHEELIAQLSLLEDVRVVSRTTVMGYAGTTMSIPEIGRELGVDVLIEGSVNRSGDQVRITLQLIHAASDSHIETIRFDREARDVLALQAEVADAVADQVAVSGRPATMASTTMTAEPSAQEAYFRGKYAYEAGTAEGYREALDHFEEAVAADPDFAEALAGLAGARFLVGLEDVEADADEIARAHDEAVAALEIDAGSMEVRDVLALIERSLPRLSGSAPPGPPVVAEQDVASISVPGSTQRIEVRRGAFDTTWVGAVTSLGQGIEQQVRNRTMRDSETEPGRGALSGRLLMTSGRYAEASRELERVVATAPRTSQAWEMLARSYVGSGHPERAVSAVQRWQTSGVPGAPTEEQAAELARAVRDEGERGYWEWTLARLSEAQAEGRPVQRTELAAAHAALGQHDRAFELLFAALGEGERGLLGLPSDPVWDELRGDRRFREVERQAQLMRFAPALRGPRGARRSGR